MYHLTSVFAEEMYLKITKRIRYLSSLPEKMTQVCVLENCFHITSQLGARSEVMHSICYIGCKDGKGMHVDVEMLQPIAMQQDMSLLMPISFHLLSFAPLHVSHPMCSISCKINCSLHRTWFICCLAFIVVSACPSTFKKIRHL
jgi:hypothetical protein